MDVAKTNELIERWVSGDRDAAAEIYERYYHRAWRFGWSLTRKQLAAEEIAHEAVAAGLEILKTDQRPDKFTGWLLGVVRRMAWKENDGTGVLPVPAFIIDENTKAPSRLIVDREMSVFLKEALAALPEDERSILERRFIRNVPREELAEEFKCSIDTIDRKANRAMAQLRDLLSGHFTTLMLKPPAPTQAQVNALRPSFREAFLMHHVDGVPVPEMSDRLKLPEHTIRERLRYAYTKLGCTPWSDFAGIKRV